MKRAIQRELQDPLARHILEGEFRDGDTIEIDDAGEGEFVFRLAEKLAA